MVFFFGGGGGGGGGSRQVVNPKCADSVREEDENLLGF